MGTNALEAEVSQLKDHYEELNAQLPLAGIAGAVPEPRDGL